MKKNCLSLVVVGLLMFILPFTVKAKEAVTVYFFKGETCSYCHAALSFFESLESDDEYKGKFVVQEYEVWNDKKNNTLMEDVAKKMGDTLQGVPYFVIGDKSWNGYQAGYDDAIKQQILKIYNDESYVDELKTFIEENGNKSEDNSTLITISIIAGVVVLIGIALFLARRDSDEEVEEEIVEEKKSEPTKKEKNAKIDEVQEEKIVEEKESAPKKVEEKKKAPTSNANKKQNTTKKSNAKKTVKNTTKKSTSTKKTTTNKKAK